MKLKKLSLDFAAVFVITLVVTILVTYFWNLIFHSTGAIDWETSFRFAIIFGIILPWIEILKNRKR